MNRPPHPLAVVLAAVLAELNRELTRADEAEAIRDRTSPRRPRADDGDVGELPDEEGASWAE